MLLAAARYLARQPNFSGTLHLIFQPAAEGGGGAKEAAEAAGDPDDELWPWDEFPEDAVFVKDDFATVQAKFSCESGEAAAALKDAAADVLRPLLDNFNHLRSLNTVFDTEDYHVGMPFGK
jgi:metal-dependent amidase/aminoacylase/carboxypeptidase family protein